MDDRIRFILNNYGYRHQLAKAKEELREEIEAIEQVEEALDSGNFAMVKAAEEHMAEEGADVGIVLDQLMVASGREETRDEYREYKLERQIARIVKGE